MAVTIIVKNSTHPRRALLRREGPPGTGGIVESVVCDPDMSFREAERTLVESAREQGIPQTNKTIRIASDRRPGPGPKLISHPGRPARQVTARDRR